MVRQPAIGVDQAVAAVLETVEPLGSESLDLVAAIDRVAADDL